MQKQDKDKIQNMTLNACTKLGPNDLDLDNIRIVYFPFRAEYK